MQPTDASVGINSLHAAGPERRQPARNQVVKATVTFSSAARRSDRSAGGNPSLATQLALASRCSRAPRALDQQKARLCRRCRGQIEASSTACSSFALSSIGLPLVLLALRALATTPADCSGLRP